jgi:hypothetical protein
MRHKKNWLSEKATKTNLTWAAVAVLAVFATGYLMMSGGASGFFAATEPESGTASGNANVVNDSSASGGKAIQFTAAATPPPPPPPPPPPSGSCSGAANHVAGGADGTGTCWPGANNTGVPSGTTLTSFTGGCTITTAGLVIDAKTINCSSGLSVKAANVTIKNSKVNGYIVVDTDANNTWSLNIKDYQIYAGPKEFPAFSNGNITALRVHTYRGHNGLECQEHSTFCTMQDSYIHGQYVPPIADPHLGGILVMAGNNIRFEHNTVTCDANNGCSGDINLIPYYDPPTIFYITGAIIKHNLLGASTHLSYCTYGGTKIGSHGTNIVYQDNVFQRGSNAQCGAYGPVTGFESGNAGNQWINNKWDNGAVVNPAN